MNKAIPMILRYPGADDVRVMSPKIFTHENDDPEGGT